MHLQWLLLSSEQSSKPLLPLAMICQFWPHFLPPPHFFKVSLLFLLCFPISFYCNRLPSLPSTVPLPLGSHTCCSLRLGSPPTTSEFSLLPIIVLDHILKKWCMRKLIPFVGPVVINQRPLTVQAFKKRLRIIYVDNWKQLSKTDGLHDIFWQNHLSGNRYSMGWKNTSCSQNCCCVLRDLNHKFKTHSVMQNFTLISFSCFVKTKWCIHPQLFYSTFPFINIKLN